MEQGAGQSGGVHFGSTVGTIGGDVTGGNKTVTIIHAPPSAHEAAFAPVAEAIRTAKPEDQPAAEAKLVELKAEVAKGSKADDGVMAKLVDGLVKQVPGAASAVWQAFGRPVLQGVAGPVTQIVLKSLGQG